jgi:tetratricopeptide (TPR) repeat protein
LLAREKQKGNESFRSGENDEAYSYYSRSLALDDSVAAVYSNRALVCLRTGKLETAEDDCSRALFLDPSFTKARSRRGIARLKSGKYELVSGLLAIYTD